MARNAHPELTQERIIKAATELFTRQGYDKTGMQDIIDVTGDLSKEPSTTIFDPRKTSSTPWLIG